MERIREEGPFSRNEFYVNKAQVIPDRGLILHGGKEQRLERKVMAVLLCLAERPGEVVRRDELIARVWGQGGATADLLSRAVGRIRRALEAGENGAELETVRGVGYCLVGSVRRQPVPQAEPAAPPAGRRWLTPATASGLSFAASAAAWLTICLLNGAP